MERADVVVIGGGSAGAIVAARLSEDPRRKVLLIEAGRDTAPGATPADIRSIFPRAYTNRGYFWPRFTTSYRANEPPIPFLQPKVIGNACIGRPQCGLRIGRIAGVVNMDVTVGGMGRHFDMWQNRHGGGA